MDESLSEFKEKKEACKGPKNSQKPVNKGKPKKLPKRIKGQKDIRTALKSKKNEQLKYAQEFDEVCKQSGVDIDPEQLQIAIALSKSLQTEDNNDIYTTNKPLSAEERCKKIRTTLQEYGFCVPEIKIANKRVKNKKKNYKLLLSTDEQKNQIISDRYAQVLFSNSTSSKNDSSDIDCSSQKCYFVATEITYMSLQNNDILYVDDLLEKSNSKGSLLKDWVNIPGRPQSPVKREPFMMNISEIECSQEELDIILSGTLIAAKSVVKNKVKSTSIDTPTVVINLDDIAKPELPQTVEDTNDKTLVNEAESSDVSKNKTLCVSDRVRSCSPDIFDDDISIVSNDDNDKGISKSEQAEVKAGAIMDLTQENKPSSKMNAPRKDRDNFMDLTNAESHEPSRKIDTLKQNMTTDKFQPLSQGSDYTRRKSDDFMEMTECIGISSLKTNPTSNDAENSSFKRSRRHSQELIEVIESVATSRSLLNANKEHIQLDTTASQTVNRTKRKSNDPMEITECVSMAGTSHYVSLNVEDNIDLTQNSDEATNNIVNGIVNTIIENIDLSQSSNSGDELPFVQVSGTNKSLDDTILLNNEEIFGDNSPNSTFMSKPCTVTSENVLDLTDTPPSPNKISENVNTSIFDEFVHNHSDEITKETESILSNNNDLILKEINDDDEVDLTQSSNSSMASTENNSIQCNPTSKVNLGKKDDVSIDYDEVYDDITNNHTDISAKKTDSVISAAHDITGENYPKTSESDNTSMKSQIFDISDKELEYSINQSRYDIGWENEYGVNSVVDRDSSPRKSDINNEKTKNCSDDITERSMSDSLPIVKVKSNENQDKFKKTAFKENTVTPFKAFTMNSIAIVNTPSSEYIVKTDQVTPILDYTSMSTPERNRELDKYGLKPFKRKRAIQLLTHLYNQTHPIVDSCQDDLPSPSKKRKPSQLSPKKMSPRKKSPRKLMKSPAKEARTIDRTEGHSENNVYEVTNEVPDIKAVDCPEEDWVFQKREKAKLHSCRVPLHIALHNFVSCRKRLREAILRYEPVNIDVIHKELVASGHKYDPKDLLKYLDKKCITVKTADNNARNNKR